MTIARGSFEPMDAKSSPTSREIRGGDLSNRSGNCHLFIIDAALCIPELGQLEPGGVAVLTWRVLRSRKIVHSGCLPMRREDSYEHPHSLPWGMLMLWWGLLQSSDDLMRRKGTASAV